MQLDDVIETFEFLDSWEDRYRLIIDLGRELPEFPEEAKTEDNRVEGCVSKVWLLHDIEQTTPQRLTFRADSDAFIVRGLIALILMAYSGRTPEEIRQTDIEGLFQRLGLEQQLSPNRRNGFFSMVERIKHLADQAQAA
ncbi:SufE family protein [Methylonatrum kenyense]|uniref:SufE family protein n=1 Tax=Methylonatrum kenyense TaxID=455253 RepID=UPI0020C10584|nr:SufE family protein [Methylonatrum kenyense]MCK8514830.1 SufE family protein [Methylonatrum kenyense]